MSSERIVISSNSLPLTTALGFCLATSVAFVGSLYVLVPAPVRKLGRDHARQIQWRAVATAAVCLGAWVVRQRILLPVPALLSTSTPEQTATAVLPFLLRTASSCSRVLLHAVILYIGPVTEGAALVAFHVQRRPSGFSWQRYIQGLYNVHVGPTLQSLHQSTHTKWVTLRNLVLAPALEEIAFRACLVPVLLASDLSPVVVCWTAPLFFGVAHVHHAVSRLRQGGLPPATVAFQTTFQFAYTTLFGAYASYAYLQTQGSTVAIILVHSYCNWMGLPTLAFLDQAHSLYGYRHALLGVHVMGLLGFTAGFHYRLLSS
jgi:prenyl protein peptidase